jgi:tetratricopeptide (TPR) repeat protein
MAGLKKTLSVFIFLVIAANTFAQKNTNEELAAQYFANKEFDKASVLYKALLTTTPTSPYYYENLLTCYFELKDFKEAEKMVKRQKKRFKRNFYYKVDLGYVYEKDGNEKAAKKEYEKALKDLKKQRNEVTTLSNAFIKRDLYDWAIETVQEGRKLYGDEYIMTLELASLYHKTGESEKMISEYINHLGVFPNDLEQVQNGLLENISKKEDWKLLKKELLKKIQSSVGTNTYTEMLLWLLVQQKDFYGAFIQFRAIDKRKNEEGERLLELANIAISNEALDVAVDCYKYIIDLGEDKLFYNDARSGLLAVSYKKITEYGEYDDAFLAETEKNYLSFINEVGKNYVSANAMRQLAKLYNYYSNQPQKAIDLLQTLIAIPRVTKSFNAEVKLELGDAYLIGGDIWEAQLLYGQVDKDFKDEPLGQEAKFRNARLSFYKGEFDWAQAQLDVLKSATSHLISNNAIELSMLIQDNYGFEDGDDTALMLYADADLLLLRNAPDAALKKLDTINLKFPNHSLNDEMFISKARIFKKKKEYQKAVDYYHKVFTNYRYDILADNAIFELAELYERRLDNKEKAKELYEKIILEYPGSLFTAEARKRYRRLRGDGV